MSIPSSGTYRLTIVRFRIYSFRTIGGRRVGPDNFMIESQWQGERNQLWQNAEVKFDGRSVSILEDGKPVHNFVYGKVAGQGNYRYDSVMVQVQGSEVWYLISNEKNPHQAGEWLQRRRNTDIWDYGERVYSPNYSSEGAFRDLVPICFLPGTLIETPSGRVSVEDLRAGDEIIAYDADGSSRTDILKWVGKAETSIRQNAHPDMAGYPVRILKGAITNGVPFKDLLITPEHCLFIDGKFIPVRMLVNGSSIYYDTSFTSYEYFHIETEKHSVIMADGMLTESYLDTGNRNAFQQNGPLFFLGRQKQDVKTWAKDAAAPLVVDSAVVEPIYRQIEGRARNMQCAIKAEPVSLTEEMNLYLKTDRGQIIRPTRRSDDKIVFMIPEQTGFVRIVSNASRPCDIIGPFVDDRRELGVLIGEISLFTGSQTESLTDHLRNEALAGWNNLEKEAMRWTDGEALLPLNNVYEGAAILAIQVIAGGPYLAKNEQVFENRSAA